MIVSGYVERWPKPRPERNLPLFIGFFFGLWFLLWPTPYMPLFLANASAPLIALACAARWPNVAFIESKLLEVDVEFIWAVPAFAVVLHALNEANLLDWRWPTAVALAPAILVLLAAMRLDSKSDRGVFRLIFTLMLLWAWSCGVLTLANRRFDPSAPSRVEATVTATQWPRHRTRGELTLQLPGRPKPVAVFALRCQIARASLDRPTIVSLRAGRFGWRHLELDPC